MKRIKNLFVMTAISFLLLCVYTFAQSDKQNQQNQNTQSTPNMTTQTTAQADTNYEKSMSYYNYAKKNIIEDKSEDGTYKGKFYNQDNLGKSSSETDMNKSKMKKMNKKMGNSNMNNMNSPNMNRMNNDMVNDSTKGTK
jgi:hypothetical protein